MGNTAEETESMEQTGHDVGQAFLPVLFVTPTPVGIARPLGHERQTGMSVPPQVTNSIPLVDESQHSDASRWTIASFGDA